MTEALVRVLTEQDVDAFWHLRLRSLAEHPEAFGASLEESKALSHDEILQRVRPRQDAFVLGLFYPELVGLCGFFRRSGLKLRHKGTIWGVYIAPEARGNKLGHKLIRACLHEASKMQELTQISLTVVTGNKQALSLYESFGFEQYGLETKALKIDDQYYDEILMECDLSKLAI